MKNMEIKVRNIAVALAIGCSAAVGVLATGCAGDRYERSTGEYVDDKALSVRVHSALGDNPEYKFGEVSVKSYRGVVQLSGFVNTVDQKRIAGDIAARVENVRRVENNISIKPPRA